MEPRIIIPSGRKCRQKARKLAKLNIRYNVQVQSKKKKILYEATLWNNDWRNSDYPMDICIYYRNKKGCVRIETETFFVSLKEIFYVHSNHDSKLEKRKVIDNFGVIENENS